jgi:gamma-glutamyltranspeptidase/glutathione hydrolase
MSPTLVLSDDRPFLILGSPGGSRIITTVAQAIILMTRFGLNARVAVDHPRCHHQWLPDTLYVERGGYPEATMAELRRYGHAVSERSPYCNLHVVQIDGVGLMTAAADMRRRGSAMGY